MNSLSNTVFRENAAPDTEGVNVGNLERWASMAGGAALLLYGLSRRSLPGLALALAGADFVYRGASGFCWFYNALGVDTSGDDSMGRGLKVPNLDQLGVGRMAAKVMPSSNIHIEKTITILKSPEELYGFWRNFENLPRFMKHLAAVRVLDDKRSHWVAKAPLGTTIEWEAEISEEQPNHLIAWRSLPNATIDNSGSVSFTPVPADKGTAVYVVLDYQAPAGAVGSALAKLFQEEPGQQVEDDLRRFKAVMEAGEYLTTEGQSSGRDNSKIAALVK